MVYTVELLLYSATQQTRVTTSSNNSGAGLVGTKSTLYSTYSGRRKRVYSVDIAGLKQRGALLSVVRCQATRKHLVNN